MLSLVYLAETVAENEVEVGLSDDLHRLLNHMVSVLVRDALNQPGFERLCTSKYHCFLPVGVQ